MDKSNSKWTLVLVFAAGLILGNLCAVGLLSQASAQQGIATNPTHGNWCITNAEGSGIYAHYVMAISPSGTFRVVGVTQLGTASEISSLSLGD